MELIKTQNSNWIYSKFFTGNFRYFMIPFIGLMIAGAISLLLLKKGDIVLAVNNASELRFDHFFLFVTRLGLGGTIAIVAVLFALYKFRWSVLILIDLILTGIFTNLFKEVFFHLSVRPLDYFLYDDFHRFLYDVPLSYYNTFPSGHTTAIFGFCSLLALLLNRKYTGIALFFLACLVGFSRIYLLQHFFIDTYFGALMGIISTILTFRIDERLKLARKRFADKNLIHLIKAI